MIRDIIKKVVLDKKELTQAEKEELLRWFELRENDSDIKIYEEDWNKKSGDWVVEDLTSQIDGATNHFTISTVAKSKLVVNCNLQQQPGAVVMDANMLGFTLNFTPTTRDKLVVEIPT